MDQPPGPIITLTSDFGPGLFVGLMKGVILSLCPSARLVDLEHGIAAQDVRAGALALEAALGVFPAGTVHLAVVDPGVGTSRRGLALKALGQFWVGPDNGLFTPVWLADPQTQGWELTEPAYFRQPVSQTFHGRDVFAPVAARLATGLDPARLGPPLTGPVLLDWPRPYARGPELVGQVLGADCFGNLLTNLGRAQVEAFLAGRPALVRLAGLEVRGLSAAYGQAPSGVPLALFNSQQRLELALNQGDLRGHLGLEAAEVYGLEVTVGAGE
ncbi:MAG: SAM-dependent chlorinase/fluorinase [Desulfarculus sp.]|nr:SAM-dependent chlorinase/fluorinase [Desulfarculus sp.]